MRSRVGFERRLSDSSPTSLSTQLHCLLKSGWADLTQNLDQHLSVIGRDGREAPDRHWCLLVLQNSPAYIIFHGVQERSTHSGALLCLETGMFKFQPQETEE